MTNPPSLNDTLSGIHLEKVVFEKDILAEQPKLRLSWNNNCGIVIQLVTVSLLFDILPIRHPLRYGGVHRLKRQPKQKLKGKQKQKQKPNQLMLETMTHRKGKLLPRGAGVAAVGAEVGVKVMQLKHQLRANHLNPSATQCPRKRPASVEPRRSQILVL